MDKFQATFIAEAKELLVDLEKALLDFEQDLQNEHSVEEIFRIMHTLKGGGSMFGFEAISNLTHELETIYDQIRAKQLTATMEILGVTLQALDHLKDLLDITFLEKAQNRQVHDTIRAAIHHLATTTPVNQPQVAAREKVLLTHYVLIEPRPAIFNNGTNPLFLVDDVVALGQAIVLPDLSIVPGLEVIEPVACYTRFEILLATDKPVSEIHDVFIFAEDQCSVTVKLVGQGNLIQLPAIQELIRLRERTFTFLGYEAILAVTQTQVAKEAPTSSKHTATPEKAKTESSIRVASDKLNELMNLVSELVTTQASLSLLAEKYGLGDLTNVAENMEKITRRLRDNAFAISLVPVDILVTRFQRLVRDLSKDLKKDISFIATGTETELDKSIIENITDPILHIIRNSIDHGIELPEERIKKGKKPQGQILLNAFHSGTHVYLQIKDNGKGIDPARLRQKAIDKGLINADQRLSDQEVLELIFAPGFSTAEKITDISGRGVGMDIVRRNIEGIQGKVSIESAPEEGTTITIKLPPTLSIIDGMLVRVGAADYIIPLTSVEKCYEIETAKIKSDLSQRHMLDGELTPVFNLRARFDEPVNPQPITQIIKIRYDRFPLGITVDAIIGEYQAVMRPLGDLYQDQEEFSGATILGDGSVALVIDTTKFVQQLVQEEETQKARI